jgi:uncharacterized protein
MNEREQIERFLAGDAFAVVGASKDRTKYGNKVLRAYLQAGKKVFPINPRETEIEGLACYPDLASLPEAVHGVSIVTPPAVTEKLIPQIAAVGIKHVWLQPGSETAAAMERAAELGLNTIGGGQCVLVTLGYRE